MGMISHLEEGLRSPPQRKWKNFQKYFSCPTRPWTKPAVNWSRFHFLITFSWGTIATPLPNPGHSRPLAFFPRQLTGPSTTNPQSLRKCKAHGEYGRQAPSRQLCTSFGNNACKEVEGKHGFIHRIRGTGQLGFRYQITQLVVLFDSNVIPFHKSKKSDLQQDTFLGPASSLFQH